VAVDNDAEAESLVYALKSSGYATVAAVEHGANATWMAPSSGAGQSTVLFRTRFSPSPPNARTLPRCSRVLELGFGFSG
jgi:hypothetical protein